MWQLFANPPPDRFVEIAQLVRPEGRKEYLHSTYHEPSGVATLLASYKGKTDVYLGVALRKAKAQTKEAVGEAKALWVDWDNTDYPPTVLPPSFIVKTAHGLHLLWLLDTWIEPDKFEALNKTLIAHLGAGKAGADKCWYRNSRCRVPGTLHSETGEEMKLVGNGGYIYSTGDITSLPNIDTKLSRKILTGDSRGYPSRSELDFAVIKELVAYGFSDVAIRNIFAAHRIGQKTREHPVPEHYLTVTIAKARASTTVLPESEGFHNQDGSLVFRQGKSVRQVATFTLSPVKVLSVDGDTDILECRLRAGGVLAVHQFPRAAFNSLRAFVDNLPRMEWQWLGTDNDVRALLPWLYNQLETTDKTAATKVAGRHKDYIVLPDGTIDAQGTVHEEGEGPIVYVPGAVTAPSPYLGPLSCDPQEVVTAALRCNTEDVMVPVLGWLFATALKTELDKEGVRFPLLDIFGTQGCGKTTLVSQVLLRMLEYESIVSFDATTTRFVLLSLLGCTNMLPVCLAEFRAAAARDYLLRYIRLMYDLGDDPRGKPDQTVSHYPLLAPVIIDGEDALNEPAALERTIGVRLTKSNIEPGSDPYKGFLEWKGTNVKGFATAWFKHTLTLKSPVRLYRRGLEVTGKISDRLPHRVANNFAVVWAGWLALSEWLGEDILPDSGTLAESIKHSYNFSTGRNKMYVDDLVEQVVLSVSQKDAQFFYRYDANANEVLFHFGSVMSWYEAQCRRRGTSTLSRDALAAQLDEAPYVSGTRVVESRWCYVVNLLEAARVLDVPSSLSLTQLIVDL